jgi:hypothetical protein
MPSPCPHCGAALEGLGLYCWGCRRYVDDGERAVTGSEPSDTLPDTRSEDERKRDALSAVQALGWWIVDNEQGWRPFACPRCKNKIPGGSRVTLGLADWLCVKDGTAAFIEWKSGTGTQADSQRDFADQCDAAGIPYRGCRTTEQAVGFLKEVRDG